MGPLVHCRSLGHLSALSLERVIVRLPELEAVAPNLVHLSLHASVLTTGRVARGALCDTFAKGIWGKLQTLNLSDACTSAPLLDVALPMLLELRMDSFWHQKRRHVRAQGLGQGCPGCTSLSFHLEGMAVEAAEPDRPPWKICMCSAFAALRSVSVVCMPDDLRPGCNWPVLPPALGLPPSVTRLEALCDTSASYHGTLNLWTALVLAAYANHYKHTPLKELVCVGFSSYIVTTEDRVQFGDDMDNPEAQMGFTCSHSARLAEATRKDLIHLYSPYLRLLHGRTSISLIGSPACSEEMVDALLAFAPDLRKLDCVLKGSMATHADEGFLGHSFTCTKLSELHITYVLEDRQQHEATATVVIHLYKSECLHKFTLRVAEMPTAGDFILVFLNVDKGAELVSTCTQYSEAAACAELCVQRRDGTAGDGEQAIWMLVMWNLVGDDGEGWTQVDVRSRD